MEQYKESPQLPTMLPIERERAQTLRKIVEDYFPRRFDFFGCGALEATGKDSVLREIGVAHLIVMFQITGDERGFCVVGFDRAPQIKDETMFVEMANVLVSKFANSMSDATGSMVMVSPPETLEPAQKRHKHLITTLQNAIAPNAALKRYEYIHKDATRISVRMAFVPERYGRT